MYDLSNINTNGLKTLYIMERRPDIVPPWTNIFTTVPMKSSHLAGREVRQNQALLRWSAICLDQWWGKYSHSLLTIYNLSIADAFDPKQLAISKRIHHQHTSKVDKVKCLDPRCSGVEVNVLEVGNTQVKYKYLKILHMYNS